MLRKKTKYVLYPEYFDKSLTRAQGRRVSLEEAVEDATFKKIFTAAKLAELNPIEEPEKAYPRNWIAKRGRILVDKNGSKRNVIKKVARIARKLRKKTAPDTASKKKPSHGKPTKKPYTVKKPYKPKKKK